jgi:DNA-binding transcriptional ArsR family regulator
MNPDLNQLSHPADIFNALSHPARIEILELLREGESCVCHIQAMLDQRQAYVSQQLNILRQAGLITSRKDGLRAYYQVSDPALFDLLDQAMEMLRKQGKLGLENPCRDELRSKKMTCKCPQCAEQAVGIKSESVQEDYA